MKLVQVVAVSGVVQRNSVIFGSVFAAILDSKKTNLSLTLVMAALVNAFSTHLIHIEKRRC